MSFLYVLVVNLFVCIANQASIGSDNSLIYEDWI